MSEPGEYVKCTRPDQLWCTHKYCGYVPWSALYTEDGNTNDSSSIEESEQIGE